MRLEAPVPAEVMAAIRAPFLERAAEPLEAPVMQPLGVLLDLAGETLRERLFIVQGDGPEACLRPDFTVPALRAHVASGRPGGRYLYSGHAFRVAPRGSTRAEEFSQIGVEAFEPGEPALADAEMAALAWRAAAAGGRRDLILLMGDVGLFGDFIDALGVAPPLGPRLKRAFSNPGRLRAELARAASAPAEAGRGSGGRLTALLSGLSEDAAAGVLEEIWALAGVEPVGGRSAAEVVHRLTQRAALAAAPRLTAEQIELIQRFLAIAGEPAEALGEIARLVEGGGGLEAARADWIRRLEAMTAAGVPAECIRFSAAFGRAFGYYDGVMFEVRAAALGEDQPVAAGGRYDSLPAKLGARLPTGAVGCMVRPGLAWTGLGAGAEAGR